MAEVMTSRPIQTETGIELQNVTVFYTEAGHRLGSMVMSAEEAIASEENK